MGRKKIYKTETEKRVAYNQKQMEYYWRNAEKIKEKNLNRYHSKKKENEI
jgi:hypothetical protein